MAGGGESEAETAAVVVVVAAAAAAVAGRAEEEGRACKGTVWCKSGRRACGDGDEVLLERRRPIGLAGLVGRVMVGGFLFWMGGF